MTYQEAKKFVKSCTVVNGYSDPCQERLTVKDGHNQLWQWWESKLESPEDGWQLSRIESEAP